MTELTTLCYMEKDGQYLMLHRIKKKNDINKDKWIGIGGHFEKEESPEECILREVYEETGLTLTSYRYRGLITFVYNGTTEYMSLFTSDCFTGNLTPCSEGVLEWVNIEDIWNLNLWEGDKIFFRLLDENQPFFSLKLVYNSDSTLKEAVLNGKRLELFDILSPAGSKTGMIKERGVAHRDGSLHGTAHIWIVRPTDKGYDVLLQKRSLNKESFPGCYDTSAAGHIAAGDEPLFSALRELHEELGICAREDELLYLGTHYTETHTKFRGMPFHDCELSHMYLYEQPIVSETLSLQQEEVEDVLWMDMERCLKAAQEQPDLYCFDQEEFRLILLHCLSNRSKTN